jgi:hypothetical protein
LVLHEAAHYVVHVRYAASVSIGVNRLGPYVEAIYEPSAPTPAIRAGSVAPTLLYTPLVALGTAGYLSVYPIPRLGLVEWSFVIVPLVILITPTQADLQGCLVTSQ